MRLIFYSLGMKGVAKVLDIFQGDQYMFMGVLLQTLVALMRQLHFLPKLKFYGSLVGTLKIAVITTSFSHCFFCKIDALFAIGWLCFNDICCLLHHAVPRSEEACTSFQKLFYALKVARCDTTGAPKAQK